jgi:hypothetical protein
MEVLLEFNREIGPLSRNEPRWRVLAVKAASASKRASALGASIARADQNQGKASSLYLRAHAVIDDTYRELAQLHLGRAELGDVQAHRGTRQSALQGATFVSQQVRLTMTHGQSLGLMPDALGSVVREATFGIGERPG